jgi:cardiolipin synthase A/B
MEAMYLDDLSNATEVVLDLKHKVCAPGAPTRRHPVITSGGGSAGRAAAGALRIGNAIGAAFTSRRLLEPVEAKIFMTFGLLLLIFALLFVFFPGALVYPVTAIFTWLGIALLLKAYRLRQLARKRKDNVVTRDIQ